MTGGADEASPEGGKSGRERTGDRKTGTRARQAAPAVEPTERAVVDYLRLHPDFLARHGELATILTPPSHNMGEGVVDLQRYMIERVQAANDAIRGERDALVRISRSNLSGQVQVHNAVLALLAAEDFEDFVHILTTDLGVFLDIDVVSLCVEMNGTDCPKSETAGIYALPEGRVAALTGPELRIVLRESEKGMPDVFGAGADLVQSYALVPLQFGRKGRTGVLALGSRTPGNFSPRDGTDLLAFMGKVVEISVRQWLGLPR